MKRSHLVQFFLALILYRILGIAAALGIAAVAFFGGLAMGLVAAPKV